MKTLSGRVVSAKMNKTIVVSIGRSVVDPLYKKIYKRSHRIKAHNEIEGVKEGDMVKIVSSRPFAKDTHYKVVEKA